jgi:hypothetical protein
MLQLLEFKEPQQEFVMVYRQQDLQQQVLVSLT